MMLPNDRLLEILRSSAAASAMSLNNDVLNDLTRSFAPTMSTVNSLTQQIGRSQLNQLAEIGRDVARRQAELFKSSWSTAVFASMFRWPEIESMLQGLIGQIGQTGANFLKSVGASFFKSMQQSGTLANPEVLRQTHAAGLAQQFREAVEKSEDGKQMANEIAAIVEENLKETGGSEFVTKERLMMLIAILSLLATFLSMFYRNTSIPQSVT